MQAEDGPAVAVVLTSCTVTSPQSYTLDFQAGTDAPAQQGTYLLAPDDGAEPVPVFLVPSPPTADGVAFHAVFTHLAER